LHAAERQGQRPAEIDDVQPFRRLAVEPVLRPPDDRGLGFEEKAVRFIFVSRDEEVGVEKGPFDLLDPR
jgi:hypothetical protein